MFERSIALKKTCLAVKTIAIVLLVAIIAGACGKSEKELKVVNLNEVVHSIFYAPQYVAIEKGFFEEEGLKINLSVGQGADKSMTALVSKNADIALMGTEAGIYVYNEGKEDFAVAFAQLTQRAGNFLVSRTDDNEFRWTDVKGKTIIGGRAGGMPQMVLEYILRQNGLDPASDVEILTNLQFTTTAGAFTGGIGDYTAEFDPSAYALEKSGAGYVVADMGTASGKIPYTVFFATKSYLEDNPEVIQKFTNAIYKAQLWVDKHSAKEIAEVIAPHFTDQTTDDLTFMIDRYKQQEAFKNNPLFEEESLGLIQDIMSGSGMLDSKVPYKDIVNTEFAENAMKNIN